MCRGWYASVIQRHLAEETPAIRLCGRTPEDRIYPRTPPSLSLSHLEAPANHIYISQEGEIYNSPSSVKAIPSFIETYNLDLSDALHTEFSCYENFNDFFTRKLKPGARPIQDEEDPATVPSIADCRLMVYDTVGQATKFWCV